MACVAIKLLLSIGIDFHIIAIIDFLSVLVCLLLEHTQRHSCPVLVSEVRGTLCKLWEGFLRSLPAP